MVEIATWRPSADSKLRGKNHKIVLKKKSIITSSSLSVSSHSLGIFFGVFWRALSLLLVSHIRSLSFFPIPLRLVLLIAVKLLFLIALRRFFSFFSKQVVLLGFQSTSRKGEVELKLQPDLEGQHRVVIEKLREEKRCVLVSVAGEG